MPGDFDTFLRDAAPEHPVREDHKRQLKLVLMSKVKDRNPRLPLSAAGAFVIVVILALTSSQSELGSFDFNLVPVKSTGSGLAEYRGGMGNLYVAVDPANLSKGHEQAMVEGIIEHELARQEELHGITGWTIDGSTFFMVHCTYEIDGERTQMSRFSHTPAALPRRDQATFILQNQTEVLDLIAANRGHFLGTEDRIIDGNPVRFKKWAVRLPDQPEVICWLGSPIE